MKNAFLLAGFARNEITPETSMPLQGYGNTKKRMNVTVLDELDFTVIALTDKKNKTVLLCTVDLCNNNRERTEAVRKKIAEATGVDFSEILITATHTHSGPDTNIDDMECVDAFCEKYASVAAITAKQALADRVPAAVMYGETKTEGLNFVRHYYAEDGGVVTDNHSTRKSPDTPIVKHITEVDPTMQLIRFVRTDVVGEVCGIKPQNKKDILYVNWRAHGTKVGSVDRFALSADYPYAFRTSLEKETGLLCGYYQGAAGNVNPQSRIECEKTTTDYMVFGKQLADVAIKALDNMTDVKEGLIRNKACTFTYNVNHALEEILDIARKTQAIWKETNDAKTVREFCMPYGIFSPYHANAIVARHNMSKTSDCELNVVAIADIGFTYVSGELFDSIGKYIRDNSPYTHTIAMAYTNQSIGYIPSKAAYSYGCYEADCTRIGEGTAEKIAEKLLVMLKEIK